MKSEQITEETKREDIINLLKETESFLLKATQNLGHPAYGLSSSTTIGIDELREECFDFMEFPKKD